APPPTQVAGQTATTSQGSFAASSATQIAPSNTNIAVRVLSPGDDGDVAQTNSAASSASAGNQASTGQSADQTQGAGGVQTATQDAGTEQLAAALSLAEQVHPSNANVPVRVLSPGSGGDVTQSNDASSRADAGNAATTEQSSDQSQSGSSCGCDGGGVQTAKQAAGTEQAAGALSAAEQVHPTNRNVSVRVLSEGDD